MQHVKHEKGSNITVRAIFVCLAWYELAGCKFLYVPR